MLASRYKNVFHDSDMFAPFSGLPQGGEGGKDEREERAKSLKVCMQVARIRDATCDWLCFVAADRKP